MRTFEKFKRFGKGMRVDEDLVRGFPMFSGKAPKGHWYPQAFREGATDEDYCFVEVVHDEDMLLPMVLLRRTLPSGRTISIDTMGFSMLNGGTGIAHINMNNGDNRVENLTRVNERRAREMLLSFDEDAPDPNPPPEGLDMNSQDDLPGEVWMDVDPEDWMPGGKYFKMTQGLLKWPR